MSARSTRELLARHYGTLPAWREAMLKLAAGDEETLAELDNVDRVGGTLTEELAEFFKERHNVEVVDDLARELEVEAAATPPAPRLAHRREDHRLHRHVEPA